MESFSEIIQRHGQRIAGVVIFLMVIAIAATIAQSTLFVLDNLQEPTPPPVTGSRDPVSKTPEINLSELNLFGVVAEETAAPVAVDAPETRLNLELQGVFTADAAADSTAIVAEKGKNGELYRIGDRLPGNATLDAVFEDHILIKRGGRVEKLMFSDSVIRQQFASGANAPSLPEAPDQDDQLTRLQQIRERIAQRQISSGSGGAGSRPAQPGENLRNFVNEYRDRIDSDPAGVLTELGVSPVAEGESAGYRIGNELPSQAMLQAGLQEGDVVLSVNGTPVGNIYNDSQLIDQALESKRVRVEIQRDDRRFFLTVPIPDM
ncbi:MAG: PDZ domain-containing protein [Pseudomonadales bacterium]|nr:PDZ domain-containing protein [Pseudomonadales bacterium]